MSLRLRLVLCFAVILCLFSANLVMHMWSDRARASSIKTLSQAMTRQSRLSEISHSVSDIQKQVSLLAHMTAEQLGEPEVQQVRDRLEKVRQDIETVYRLAEPDTREKLSVFRSRFAELSASWRIFHESLGVNPSRAISELAVRGEPLSYEVMQKLLPELHRNEEESVNAATAQMTRIASLTSQVTFGIFLFSAGIAMVVAYLLSRYLTRNLNRLRVGAAIIGTGHFDHEISVDSGDELGELATAFNAMRTSLNVANKQLRGTNLELERRNAELDEERRTSEALLLNILPAPIASELRARGAVEPKIYQDVTILFTDFASFSVSTENVESRRLIELLNDYFTAFDEIITRYGLEKLKTIGDSYMCAGGIPPQSASHPVDTLLAGMELLGYVLDRTAQSSHDICWDIRIGIHTGPVIAGVVGIKKFAFDVWGATVNFSSRMESSGVANRINISEDTYLRVRDFFDCEYRGKIQTKDHKCADMYLVTGVRPELTGGDGTGTPAAFAKKYREMFQHEAPAFPCLSAQVASANQI
jgi:class 3 adenylate cyclase